MPHQYTVPLKKLIKDLNLQILYYPKPRRRSWSATPS